MMNRIQISAAACCAALCLALCAAGCTNEFSASDHSTAADVAAVYSADGTKKYNGTTVSALTVASAPSASFTKGTIAQTLTVKFSSALASSAAAAVKLYAVSSGTGATSPLTYTEVTGAAVGLNSSDAHAVNIVTPLTGDYYQLRIDGALCAAQSGQKLDVDGDGYEGEANDDTYTLDLTAVGAATALTGIAYEPARTMGATFVWEAADTGVYSTLAVYIPNITVWSAGTETSVGFSTVYADSSILAAHITAQEYDPAAGAWTNLAALTFARDTTYDSAANGKEKYVVSVAASSVNRYVRAYVSAVPSFKTGTDVYGCPLKYTRDNTVAYVAATEHVVKDDADGTSGTLFAHTADLTAKNLVTLQSFSSGRICLKLAAGSVWSALSFNDSTSTTATTVTRTPFTTAAGEQSFAGLDPLTVTADQIRVYGRSSNVRYAVKSVSYTDASNLSPAASGGVIVITLADTTIAATTSLDVYIGSGVKTASTAGMLDASDAAALQYAFGTTAPAAQVMYTGGFQLLFKVN